MAIDYQLLGKRVLQLRKEKGWSQERLAEKSGISNNYVSNIENCYSIPSLETLMKLCDAFQITPNDLLLGVSQENKSYLNRDIAELLEQCSAQEKKYIYRNKNAQKYWVFRPKCRYSVGINRDVYTFITSFDCRKQPLFR